jgi:beta-phosphoglucomutase-like phosphatase (HAD superfamily)
MQQEDLMLKAFEGNRQHLTQLENLKTIREHTELLYQQTVALRNSLGNVEAHLQNATLQIQTATSEQNPNNIFMKIKKMFGK